MSAYSSQALLLQLKQDTLTVLNRIESDYASLPDDFLLATPSPGKWSIAQVLEHLNMYGRYYLPALENSIGKALSDGDKPSELFKPGWLGGYFTKMMRKTSNGQVANKMQTPKNYRPAPTLAPGPVLREFIEQQHQLLVLLDKAARVNIGKWRIPITLSKLVRLKMGDVLSFLIAHEQRHLLQIENVARQLRAQATGTAPATHRVA